MTAPGEELLDALAAVVVDLDRSSPKSRPLLLLLEPPMATSIASAKVSLQTWLHPRERLAERGPISAAPSIVDFIHCRRCLDDPDPSLGRSPKERSRLEVGWTERGLQVRCVRHDLNIIHIDFQGCVHPANLLGADAVDDEAGGK